MDVGGLQNDKGKKGGRGGKKGCSKGQHGKNYGVKGKKGKTAPNYFAGYCGGCKKWGHKWADCWSNPANGKSGKPAGKPAEKAQDASVNAMVMPGMSKFENNVEDNIDSLMCSLVAPTAAALSMDTDPEGYTWALVDTGADTTAVPWEFGDHVDTAWESMTTLRGVAGGKLNYYGKRKIPVKFKDPLNSSLLDGGMVAHVLDVTGPVLSAGRLAEHGTAVWIHPAGAPAFDIKIAGTSFNVKGSSLLRVATGKQMNLVKKNQTYWVKVKAKQFGTSPVLAPLHDDTTLEEMVQNLPNMEDHGDPWDHALQPFDPDMEVNEHPEVGKVDHTWKAPPRGAGAKLIGGPQGPRGGAEARS